MGSPAHTWLRLWPYVCEERETNYETMDTDDEPVTTRPKHAKAVPVLPVRRQLATFAQAWRNP